MNDLFISIEGCDGSGKTTIIKELEQILNNRNIANLITFEPGGINNPFGKLIRSIVLDSKWEKLDNYTKILLFTASRNEHYLKVIKPALLEHKIVICDRYIDSTVIYQGFNNKEQIALINSLNFNSFSAIKLPKITFFINTEIETCIKRISINKNKQNNYFDLKDFKSHKEYQLNFENLTKNFPSRIKMINGNQSLNLIVNDIMSFIEELLIK